MSKREHSITVRYTDEEFDAINQEYRERLAAVIDGLSFSVSDMIRIKTLRSEKAQANQSKSLFSDVRQRRTT